MSIFKIETPFLATTINYIDQHVIGILKPFIADDVVWSEADYGYIVAAFQVAYAIGLILTGALGFIWIFFWLAYYRVPEKHPSISREELEYMMQAEAYDMVHEICK